MCRLSEAPEWATILAEGPEGFSYFYVNFEQKRWSFTNTPKEFIGGLPKDVEETLLSRYKLTPLSISLENE